MNHYVYEITNLVNGKKYIGKRSCKCPIEEDKYMGSGILISKAIKKYGKENFRKDILEICDSEELAFEREKCWIKHYNAVESRKFYNIKDGGEGNTREDALRNLAKLTPEQIKERSRKLSIANKGKNNSMYGVKGKDNPVSKAIVMMDLEGNIVKEFDCIREANDYFNKPRAFSYISNRCISKTGGAYGYMWLFKDDYNDIVENNTFLDWVNENSKVTQRAIDANDYCNNKEVYKMEVGTLTILKKYKSIQEAKEDTNIRTQAIIRNCRHGSNTAGGYSWILVEEYNSLTKEELKKLYSHKVAKDVKKPNAKRKVVCLNTEQVFDGIVDAIEYFNLCKGARIDAVCRGVRKSAGKHPETNEPLKWMYYDDYLKQQEGIKFKQIKE